MYIHYQIVTFQILITSKRFQVEIPARVHCLLKNIQIYYYCFILKQLYQYVYAVLKKNYKACVLTKLYHGAFHFESNSGFPDKSRDKSVPKNTFSWRLVLVENCTVHW